jgi:perosamine synthetase
MGAPQPSSLAALRMSSAPRREGGIENDFVLFDPVPWQFPPPKLPVLPALRKNALGRGLHKPLWLGREHRLYTKARYALRDALAACGVGPEGVLLAPAYHCRTMLDPAIALGARFELFRLTPSLTPDLDHVEQRLRQASGSIRAVLMPHFFGLTQDLSPLMALCRQHGAQLIEDCAHALPLQSAVSGAGHWGDWCIASPYKFFASPDGGVLWSGTGRAWPRTGPVLRQARWRAELRHCVHLYAQTRHRLSPHAKGTQQHREPLTVERVAPERIAAEEGSLAMRVRLTGPSADYRICDEHLGCATISRWVMNHTNIDVMLDHRRRNYRTWAEAVRGFAHARALLPELGNADAPYMFPLVVEQAAETFARIKRAGVPVYRWDSLAVSDCEVSALYRLQLLHLPCHQALSAVELRWLINTVSACLAGGPAEQHV